MINLAQSKVLLVIIALLVSGKSMHAACGRPGGRPPRAPIGVVAPMVRVAANAFEYAVNYARDRDQAHRQGDYIAGNGNYWDVLAYRENLRIQEIWEEIDCIREMASHEDRYQREQAIEAIVALLTEGSNPLTPEHIEATLDTLVGTQGQGGLAQDKHLWIRTATTVAIRSIIASDMLDKSGRTRLLDVLIGSGEQKGLAQDIQPYVRMHAAINAGNILAESVLERIETMRLIDALTGIDDQRGLAQDENRFVHGALPKVIATILASGQLDASDASRFLDILIGVDGLGGLIQSPDPWTRSEIPIAIETILTSVSIEENIRVRLLDALIGIGNEGGLMRMTHCKETRKRSTEAIGGLLRLRSTALSQEEQTQLLEALEELASDPEPEIREEVASSIHGILLWKLPDSYARSRMLDILIGSDSQRGLILDAHENVCTASAQAIETLLIYEVLKRLGDRAERARIMDALIGKDNQSGYMLLSQNNALIHAIIKVISVALASGVLNEAERTRIIHALAGQNGQGGLICHPQQDIRAHAAFMIKIRQSSRALNSEEQSYLADTWEKEDGRALNKIWKSQNPDRIPWIL